MWAPGTRRTRMRSIAGAIRKSFRTILRTGIASVFVLAVALPCASQPAPSPDDGTGSRTMPRAPGSDPEIRLPEEAQGQRAIELLGSKLPDVAARHHMTEERLRELLLRDKT